MTIWNEFFAIGMAVGPLTGGLRDAFSLRWTVGIAAVPLAAYAAILLAMPRRHAAVAQCPTK